MDSLNNMYIWTLTSVAVTGFFLVLIEGFSNKPVIYQDKNDFFRVILTILLTLISTGLFNTITSDAPEANTFLKWVVSPVTFLITFILLIDNFTLSIRQNNHRFIIGCLVAIYRYLYVLLAVLVIVRIIDGNGKKKRSAGDVLLGIMGASAVAYSISRLINGHRVELLRKNQMITNHPDHKG